VNHHNTLTADGADGTLNLPREREWSKEISLHHRYPSKQTQQKVTSKAGQLLDYRADLLNLRETFKL
jgi:hypothetical protein